MLASTPFDTIAAVSTPPGEGAIGIVRMSGDRAVEIARGIFRPNRSEGALGSSFRLYLGRVERDGQVVDEVLVSVMRAPHTYTREDVVEINCHGGAVAVNEVLRLVLERGARPAEPGEFTRRAFVNGRIDLSQAEAVLDIVRARTGKALQAAVGQLNGGLSRETGRISSRLKDMLVGLEASIDFAEEEDVSGRGEDQLRPGIQELIRDLDRLIAGYGTGRMLREGVLTAIAGRPNVGKSSLLNALLRFDRAIVTELPGTTRDVIEEQVTVRGIPFTLADTAGITDSSDLIELEGVRRSRSYLERSHLVILVFDGTRPLDRRDLEIARAAAAAPHICAVNKSDLPPRIDLDPLEQVPGLDTRVVRLSALTGEGLEELEDRMAAKVTEGKAEGDHAVLVTSARHHAVLRRARGELVQALETLDSRLQAELLAFDIRSALDILGEITGRVSSEDVLDQIFQNFCIGK